MGLGLPNFISSYLTRELTNNKYEACKEIPIRYCIKSAHKAH